MLKKLENSNCDKTQTVTKLKKLKFWQNSKPQIVTKLKNSNCDKTQKLKLWQKPKTQIVIKIKSLNVNKNQIVVIVTSLSKNNLTPWKPIRCSCGQLFAILAMFNKALTDNIYLHLVERFVCKR